MSKRNLLAVLIALAMASLAPRPASADPLPLPGTQAVSLRMIEAIKARSYDDFLADADAQLEAQLGRAQFDELCGLYAGPLRRGYRLVYLGHLRQRGTVVLLWKLTAVDSPDEDLLRIVMRDGRVEGFSIF